MSFDERPHHGTRNYTGQEATNLILGHGGFDVIRGASSNGTEIITGSGAHTDVRMWIAIKCINGTDASVCAKTLQGDDFALNAVYQATAGNEITLKDQDIVNGAFTKIRVVGSAVYILAYRG